MSSLSGPRKNELGFAFSVCRVAHTEVPAPMASAFESSQDHFAERLLTALRAGAERGEEA
jgi:uncharacterized Ntn-hydrolase superfamily protein